MKEEDENSIDTENILSTPTRSNIHACAGWPCFSDNLFHSNHKEIEVKDITSTTKTPPPRGLHAPPSNIANSKKYLWEEDEIVSPPESVNRSINFSQLKNNSGSWPFRFLREEDDLIFNRNTAVYSPLKSHNITATASPNANLRGRDSSTALRNIAPAGLGQFDYNLGITDKSSQIKHIVSKFASWSTFTFNYLRICAFRRKGSCIFILALLMLGTGSIMLLSISPASSVTTSSGEKTSSITWNHRMTQIAASILKTNMTKLEVLDDDNSPQSSALRWISENDPLRLDPLDKDLITRFTFATFYFSVNHWADRSNFSDFHSTWLSDKHFCDWTGILCFSSNDNDSPKEVAEFRFDAGNVNGPLVNEVVTVFRNLEILDLSGIGLKSSVPSNIGSLTNLKVLSLGNNDLTGPLPSEIGNISSLQILGLHNNRLKSSIPGEIWNLTQLSVLYLDGNDLQGALPIEVGNLHELVDIRLSNNQMEGTLPDTLGNLSRLKVLYLDSNHFTGSIPSTIGELKRLESVFMQNNELESQIPTELSGFENLVHFIANGNNLTGEIPAIFLEMPRLERLWLADNELNVTIAYDACESKELRLEVKVDCTIACDCCLCE